MAHVTPHKGLGGKARNHPVKNMKLRQLVEAAISLCEPENADEPATTYTRATLFKRFGKILYPNLNW